MMNILHIINGADLGGISSMLLNYYRHMDREAFHFDFIYSIDEPLGYNGKELEKLGARFFYVPKKSEGLREHVIGIQRILRENHYDAIHVHSNHTSYVALAVAKRNGIRIRVAHAHNAVKGWRGVKGTISRSVGTILIRHYATNLLACSKDAAVYTFGKRSLSDKKTCILPNGIDTEAFSYSDKIRGEVRSELNIPAGAFVFGTVGTMGREKNQIFLLEVLRWVKKRLPDCKLLIIGDGPERKNLEKSARDYSLADDLILPGLRSDVGRLINAFDVFTVPSLNEGFCIAGLEAEANGLPVVLSDAVPKELGFSPFACYLPLNAGPEKWADKILCLNGNRDQIAAERLRENGYDICASSTTLEKVYAAAQW